LFCFRRQSTRQLEGLESRNRLVAAPRHSTAKKKEIQGKKSQEQQKKEKRIEGDGVLRRSGLKRPKESKKEEKRSLGGRECAIL